MGIRKTVEPKDGREATGPDERGVALPLALALLVILGLVGAAAGYMAVGDAKVSNLYAGAGRASAAATAGITHGAAVFSSDGPTAPGAWPVTGSVDGYDYTVSARRDSFDYDGDATAGPVSMADDGTFNEDDDGREVWWLTADASRGDTRATQRLRIAGKALSASVNEAMSANSDVDITGNITVSGLNHGLDGNVVDPLDISYTGACDENKPAVRLSGVGDDVDSGGSTDLEGNPLFAATDYVWTDPSVKYVSPEQVFGLPDGALDPLIQDASTFTMPDSIDGLVYVDGDFGTKGAGGSGTIDGTGYLVVHNPLFDPREHDPSDPMYDPVKAADPAYQPATLGNINGGTFRGVIIADVIDKIDGNVDIYGGVISLTGELVAKVGAGTATINYSCEALELAASRSVVLPLRLSWMAE